MAGTNLNSATSGTSPTLWIRETEPIPSGTGDIALAISATCIGTPPTTANTFQNGCLMLKIQSSGNVLYQNTGTVASPVWSLIDTAGGFSLPTSATDSTTTTGTSFAITESTLTTGSGESITASALTTGNVYLATGSGATMASGGTLYKGTLGAATAGTAFSATTTGIYVDAAGLLSLTANSATTGTLAVISGTGLTSGSAFVITGGGANMTSSGQVEVINMGAATTGQGLQITSTGVYTGLNGILQTTGNSATTGTIVRFNGTGVTSGNVFYAVGGGANMVSGGNVGNFDMGAGIAGSAILAQTSGVYTGTDGVFRTTANSATTGTLNVVSGTGLTTGIGQKVIATAATLTTGRYFSANDSATEVFGIGANGHIHSTVSASPPTIAVTTQNGITAAAITAGGSDTCGVITTTGTNNNGGATVLTVTFGKTYTTAPKSVMLQPLNTSAVISGTIPYISSITATTFVITIPASGSSGATPSWSYLVVA